MARTKDFEFYKIAVIGDYGAGKSSLVNRQTKGTFTTLPIENMTDLNVQIASKGQVKMQINELNLQNRFKNTSTNYDHRGTKAYVIVYDSTASDAFASIRAQMKALNSKILEDTAPIIIAGTKSDLGEPTINEEDGNELAAELAAEYNKKVTFFGNTSAKANTNVADLFDDVVNKIQMLQSIDAEITDTYPSSKHKEQLSDIVRDDFNTEQGCLDAFMRRHTAVRSEEWFQSFRSSKIDGTQGLAAILKHAAEGDKGDNRSRQVCIAMNWMDKNGNLNQNAPAPVRDNYPKSENTQQYGSKK